MLDPAERMLGHPRSADLLGRRLGIGGASGRFEPGAVGHVKAVAERGRLRIGEGGIFGGRRVTVVADQVHRLMISEYDDGFAALARRLALKLLERANDLERVRAAVGDVAE